MVGTLLAAPEVIDRLVGLERLEGLLRQLTGCLGTVAERFLRSQRELIYVSLVLLVSLAILVIIAILADLGRITIALMIAVAVLEPFALSMRDELSRLARREAEARRLLRASVRAAALTIVYWILSPFVVLFASIVALTALISAPATLVFKTVGRFGRGWLRTAALASGIALFVSGLTLQFLATF